jgi:hypothetical protein
MRKTLHSVIGAAVLAVLSISLLPLANACQEAEVTAMGDYPVPPIDTDRPAVTETATFALG